MKKARKILTNVSVFLCFAIVLVSLILSSILYNGGVPNDQTLPVALGIVAYSLILFVIAISTRPKNLEKSLGIPSIYKLHAAAGVLLLIVALVHVVYGFIKENTFEAGMWLLPAGMIAMVLILLAVLVGGLVLSRSGKLKKKAKREVAVAIHRLSILAAVLIYVHMLAIEYIRQNLLLVILGGIYLALVLVLVIVHKASTYLGKGFVLKEVGKENDTVHRLYLSSVKDAKLSYRPGQYAFIRFTESALPKESHPFSISSAPDGSSAFEMLVKESGDYTKRLGELKEGDLASVEGPYGNFFDEEIEKSEAPLVFLAGGIGITPILSILRHIKEHDKDRKCILLWGLSRKGDTLLLDELEETKKACPGFSYSLAYSAEEVEGYHKGHINLEFMKENGVDTILNNAHFFICGPGPMMDSMKKILSDLHVEPKRIHIEEFSF